MTLPVTLLTLPALVAPVAQDELLPARVESLDTLRESLTGLELDLLPGGLAVVQPPRFAAPSTATDPALGRRFPRVVALYRVGSGDEGLTRLAVVRHEPEDHDFARRVARLLGRVVRLHQERLGKPVRFVAQGATEASVFLLRDRPSTVGGETKGSDIYLYGTSEAATSAQEWARTIVHEWGHATLFAARGFSQPENDASGYLGERLFMGWLAADAKAPRLDDFTESAALADYARKQIAPLIEGYLSVGPGTKEFERWDQVAMDRYIGMVLSSEKALGSALVGEALYSIEGNRPSDFVEALRNAVFLRTTLTVSLPAWIPLAPDRYKITAARGTGTLALADRPPLSLAKPFVFTPKTAGYKPARAASGTLATITLTRGQNP